MALSIRNPFDLGIAEHIEDDGNFITLFEPQVLEPLPLERALEKPMFHWLSSEGGGKTSIMRVFSPSVLREVAQGTANEDLRKVLEKRKIIEGQPARPTVLTIAPKATAAYAFIEDLRVAELSKKRLFFALLDARACLRFVNSLAAFLGTTVDNLLQRATYDLTGIDEAVPRLATQGTAATLADWAGKIQQEISQLVDVGPTTISIGHDTFLSTRICDPARWKYDGKMLGRVAGVIILDDAQEIPTRQLSWLGERVTKDRAGCRVWLSSRLRALSPDLVFPEAQKDREYVEYRLESTWMTKPNKKGPRVNREKYRAFLQRVGDRRIKNGGASLVDFQEFLSDDLEDALDSVLREQLVRMQKRIAETVRGTRRFDAWLDWANQTTGLEQMIRTSQVEIMIHRDFNSKTKTLNDDPYPFAEFERRKGDSSDIRNAAKAFISRESGSDVAVPRIPMYYGFEDMAYLASFNVQQFLRTAKRLYDVSLDREVRGEPPRLPASVQDRVVREVAKDKWKEVAQSHPQGRRIQDLLTAITDRLREEFVRPNAPYPPGPVGISIPEEEYLLISSAEVPEHLRDLRLILAQCVMDNYVTVRPRHDKSDPVRVFFLNGLILAHHGLPIKSPEFQPSNLEELSQWLASGYVSTKEPRPSLAHRTRKEPSPSPGRRKRPKLDDFGGPHV